MGKLDRLLSSGEQVLHRSAPAWRPWAWIVALGLGTLVLSAGLSAATSWLILKAGWLDSENVQDVSFRVAVVAVVAAVIALKSLPPQYLVTSARVLFRRHPLGRTFEILRPDIDAVTLYKDAGTLVISGIHAGAVRRRRGASTIPAPEKGGVLHLYGVDQPDTVAAALGVPIAVAGRREFDWNAHRMWQVCLLAGMVAFIVVMAGGWATLGPVYDGIIGIDGYSVRARNLLILAYLLGMIAASGLAFYAGRILPLAAARRSLSVRQVQQVIYSEALVSFGDGERQPDNRRIKARMLYVPMPVGLLSTLFGQPLWLDAAGLEALYEALPSAAEQG